MKDILITAKLLKQLDVCKDAIKFIQIKQIRRISI